MGSRKTGDGTLPAKAFPPRRRAIRADLRRTNPNPSSYMNSIVYIVGAIVIVVVILKVLGLF